MHHSRAPFGLPSLRRIGLARTNVPHYRGVGNASERHATGTVGYIADRVRKDGMYFLIVIMR
jgi:hypothetical protein